MKIHADQTPAPPCATSFVYVVVVVNVHVRLKWL